MPRLRRSRPDRPGIRRIKSGRGFRYVGPDGTSASPEDVKRARALVIPPAWRDVWICPHPDGHIQATGVDDAGRMQYLYHEQWRRKQDQLKHEHVLEFAEHLPALREWASKAMEARGLTRERVLAAAIRLLDLGLFRVGEARYARDNGTRGLTTLTAEDVRFEHGRAVFSYLGKGGLQRTHQIADPQVVKVVKALRQRSPEGRLLRYYEGGRWHDVTPADINTLLKELTGTDSSAKDFRTWHATVLAAVGLAVSDPVPPASSARRRAVSRAVAEAAEYLGNTPTVCRASYIDRRVVDRYLNGETVEMRLEELGKATPEGNPATHGPAEKAVLRMLRGEEASASKRQR
ncbi:MAG: DNA topoisomerase IB [Catenulispora sp.]|nr:DNA topoisomerase IB [Catenulispora sp.]